MKVESQSEAAQSCLTPRDPMDSSLPGSSVHGIFEARVLEWGAIDNQDFPGGPGDKNLPGNVGDTGLIPHPEDSTTLAQLSPCTTTTAPMLWSL